MSKKYILFILLVCSSHLLFAATDTVPYVHHTDSKHCGKADTNLKGQFSIKINPGLLLLEQGLILQYNLQNNFGIFVGAGYNEDNNGNPHFGNNGGIGYTLRAGIMQYLDNAKRFYFSFQGFYRYWGNIRAVAEDTMGFTQGIDDPVINPLRQNLGSVSVGDGQQVDVYQASVSVICIDAVVGYQYRRGHFVLDVFAGPGFRGKTINLTETGYYGNPLDYSIGPYTSLSTPMSKTVYGYYGDLRLGFTLGYRFY